MKTLNITSGNNAANLADGVFKSKIKRLVNKSKDFLKVAVLTSAILVNACVSDNIPKNDEFDAGQDTHIVQKSDGGIIDVKDAGKDTGEDIGEDTGIYCFNHNCIFGEERHQQLGFVLNCGLAKGPVLIKNETTQEGGESPVCQGSKIMSFEVDSSWAKAGQNRSWCGVNDYLIASTKKGPCVSDEEYTYYSGDFDVLFPDRTLSSLQVSRLLKFCLREDGVKYVTLTYGNILNPSTHAYLGSTNFIIGEKNGVKLYMQFTGISPGTYEGVKKVTPSSVTFVFRKGSSSGEIITNVTLDGTPVENGNVTITEVLDNKGMIVYEKNLHKVNLLDYNQEYTIRFYYAALKEEYGYTWTEAGVQIVSDIYTWQLNKPYKLPIPSAEGAKWIAELDFKECGGLFRCVYGNITYTKCENK